MKKIYTAYARDIADQSYGKIEICHPGRLGDFQLVVYFRGRETRMVVL